MQLFSLPHGLLPSVPHRNCCFSHALFLLTTWQLLPVFAWQLLTRQNGNSYSTYMATTSFSICFVHSSTPSFEMAFLAHHTFLTFFKMSTMATAACYAWQLLTGPHGNSYSTYMETIICSSNNVRVFFFQGEEDYHTRDEAEPQRPTRTHTLKAVERWQLRRS